MSRNRGVCKIKPLLPLDRRQHFEFPKKRGGPEGPPLNAYNLSVRLSRARHAAPEAAEEAEEAAEPGRCPSPG